MGESCPACGHPAHETACPVRLPWWLRWVQRVKRFGVGVCVCDYDARREWPDD